jgi:uncharacterized membrane protein
MHKNTRYPIIDTIRGFAILAMMAYHFGFDLTMQGYIVQDLNHSLPWLVARSIILSTFLFVAGFSLALAQHHSAKKCWLRLARISACAILVSVGSYFMFPYSWIYFGVLHFMVLASLVCWFLARYESWILPFALAALGLGLFYQSATFDQPMLQWLGMMTHKPITEDYVPIFPWLGVMLIGLYVGKLALQKQFTWLLLSSTPKTLTPVGWLGRHSLAVYMLHQPVLLGLLWIYGALFR